MSTWIKLREQLPENSDRKVKFEYMDLDGNVTGYGHESTGWVLNKYVAMHGPEPLPTKVSSITVWQYADPDPGSNGHRDTSKE